jgi:protein SCO1/2
VIQIITLSLWLAAAASPALAHEAGHEARLPTIGKAPDFALVDQDGASITLGDFRGKVLAVAFIYTWCPDVCPLLTDKMAEVQDALGEEFGKEIAFVSITVDPERDTPEVLKEYAEAYGAQPEGWSFLTGTPAAIGAVARGFGVAVARGAGGDPDHTLLTSLVDRQGMIRLQYLGYRFDPEEFRRDLLSLLAEP